MDKNNDKNRTNSQSVVQWLTDKDVRGFVGESIASTILSPHVVWAQFILTDDQPNGNKQSVPLKEFDNIINTGLHKPVKMAEGYVSEGHANTKPIGTIAFLKKELTNAGNRIIALAALWPKERPEDIELIRELMDTEDGVNVSWELSFGDVEASEAGGVSLLDVTLNAVSIVTKPAFEGRTRFLALAAKAKNWSKAYIDALPDDSFMLIERGGEIDSEGKTFPRELRHFAIKDPEGLIVEDRLSKALEETAQVSLPENVLKGVRKTIKSYKQRLDAGASLQEVSFDEGYQKKNNSVEDTKLETLEELKAQLAVAEDRLSTALASLEETKEALGEKEDALKTKEEEFGTLASEKETLETEVSELREFKEEIEKEAEEATRFDAIKAKFEEAGVEKSEEYFSENREKLLKLEESDLDFMIQELSSASKEAEASLHNGKRIPNFNGKNETGDSISDIVKALKERKAK